ncbi:MAG TPA: hypothetical protein VJC39_05610 [Candidatus Nanoarchaeia archaeon]|nr:hypothetical protein [Candidatus Nanoarchaeia archaeon]
MDLPEVNLPKIVDQIGARVYAKINHSSAVANLKKLLETRPVKLPSFSDKITHFEYLNLRGQLETSAILAALAVDNHLENIVNDWVKLQGSYAGQVIAEIKGEVDTQRELLRDLNAELEAGKPQRQAHDSLKVKKMGDLTFPEITTYIDLGVIISRLDQTAKDVAELQVAVDQVSKVESSLTYLIASGYQAINYIIPSVEEIQDRLGKNQYDGPDFSPFQISNGVEITDLFIREKKNDSKVLNTAENTIETKLEEPPEIKIAADRPSLLPDGGRDNNLSAKNINSYSWEEVLPPILVDLVNLYRLVKDIRLGKSNIDCGELRQKLSIETMTTRGISSYLLNHSLVFGIDGYMVGPTRRFTRVNSDENLDPIQFLQYMLEEGRLIASDKKQVNDFYYSKVLDLLKQDPSSEEGFTRDYLLNFVEHNKITFPLDYNIPLKYLVNNLGTTESLEEVREGVYAFKEINLSPEQVDWIKKAAASYGINRFTPQEVITKANSQFDYSPSKRAVDKILQAKAEEWGYKVVNEHPLQYQKIDRSLTPPPAKSAKEPVGYKGQLI